MMIEEKFSSITEVLRERIQDGTYTDLLPRNEDLAREFGVNFKTVMKAVRRLKERGMLRTKRGRGTFVASRQATQKQDRTYLLPLQEGTFDDANPYRYIMRHLLDALWRQGDRHNLKTVLLTSNDVDRIKAGESSELNPESYLVHVGTMPPEYIRDLVNMGTAASHHIITVFFNRERHAITRRLPFTAISTSVETSLKDCFTHLRTRGYRKIACIHNDKFYPELRTTIADLLDEQDLEVNNRRILLARNTTDYKQEIIELIERNTHMDAMILPYARCAFSAINELEKRGLKVPDDVAIITTHRDDGGVEQGNHVLTHLEHDYDEIARTTINIIRKKYCKHCTLQIPDVLIHGNTT